MDTRRRFGAIAALTLGACLLAPRAVRAQTPADAVVAGSPVVTINYPATDEEAFSAADQAMADAGVAYVLEGSVRPPDRPAFDYARPPETRIALTGLPLGRALNEIARADSAFHYRIAGSAVVAGFGAVQTPLDRPVSPAAFTWSEYGDVLRTVASWIDPAAPDAWRVASRPDRPGTEPAPAIEISVHAGTIRDALASIAGAAPGRSLRVSYAWTRNELTMTGLDMRDGTMLAARHMAMAAAPVPPPDTARVLVTAGGGDLSPMLLDYARHTNVAIGIELLPTSIDQIRVGPGARVDVTGLSPEAALRRIVAYDSRYQVTAEHGWFLVSPRVGLAARPTVLDTPLPTFVRRNEPIDVVANDLVARLGARNSSPTGGAGAPLPSQTLSPAERTAVFRQMVAAAAARPVSVDFPRPTTGRAVVQAMAASAEATGWILRGSSARDGRVTYQLTFQFADNVTVGRSFSLDTDAPGYAPPPPPAAHRIDAIETASILREVARTAHASITAELVEPAAANQPHSYDYALMSRLRQVPVEAALSQLMEVCDGCSWKKDHDIYRVVSARVPKASSRDAWLDRKVSSFRHHFANIREAYEEVRKLGAPSPLNGITMGLGMSGGLLPEARAFDVNLGRSTIRQVLDAIASATGSGTWSVTYIDANGTFPEVSLQLSSGEGQNAGGTIPIR